MENTYTFGIEAEVLVPYDHFDEFTETIENHGLEAGEDGSISGDGEGVEVRTSGAHTKEQLIDHINTIADTCSEFDAKVNNSCGLHIHLASPLFFDQAYLRKLIFTWVAIEDVLLATQPVSRFNNSYCKRYLLQFLNDKRKGITLPKGKQALVEALSENNNERYYTLNLSALEKHGTIEVRLHAGTMNRTKMIQWVELLLRVFTYAETDYNHLKMEKLFYQPISEEKITEIFTMLRLSDETKDYYTLRIQKSLFNALKRQQELAGENLKTVTELRKVEKLYEKSQIAYGQQSRSWQNNHEAIRTMPQPTEGRNDF